MLRILFISLVVANLLLLGFQSSKPAAQPETKATRSMVKDTSIPTIHLFSEMVQDQNLLAGNRQCFSLGPFHSIEDRDETHTRLLEVSSRISERETQAIVEKGYWVFMPPYTSMLEANEELMSLQALGLDDISIIYNGEWKNAISLGYFLRQENAVRRKQGLEDKGHAAMMRVQRQAEPRYWLDYEQTPGSGRIALDMQNRPNDFMQRALPCPEEDLAQQQTSEQENGFSQDQAENLDVAGLIENGLQEAEDSVQPQISEKENDLAPDLDKAVDTAVLIEGAPPEVDSLAEPQVPEKENDLAPELDKAIDTAALIEGAQQEAEGLAEPQVPKPESNESQDAGEDEDAKEALEGPPQQGD